MMLWNANPASIWRRPEVARRAASPIAEWRVYCIHLRLQGLAQLSFIDQSPAHGMMWIPPVRHGRGVGLGQQSGQGGTRRCF
jgi:hypothetical protein